MMSKMDEVFKKVLNDVDIFYRKKIIFNHDEWAKLYKLYKEEKFDEYNRIIQKKIECIDDPDSEKICKNLKFPLKEKKNILNQIFSIFDEFGIIKSNLPKRSSLDNFGKVIERYEQSTVEQYFLDKIRDEYISNKGCYSYRGKALIKLLEYVKELFSADINSEEIAYFVRKLNSLTTYWELLK